MFGLQVETSCFNSCYTFLRVTGSQLKPEVSCRSFGLGILLHNWYARDSRYAMPMLWLLLPPPHAAGCWLLVLVPRLVLVLFWCCCCLLVLVLVLVVLCAAAAESSEHSHARFIIKCQPRPNMKVGLNPTRAR